MFSKQIYQVMVFRFLFVCTQYPRVDNPAGRTG